MLYNFKNITFTKSIKSQYLKKCEARSHILTSCTSMPVILYTTLQHFIWYVYLYLIKVIEMHENLTYVMLVGFLALCTIVSLHILLDWDLPARRQ